MATVTWKGGSGLVPRRKQLVRQRHVREFSPIYAWENNETSAIFNTAGGNVTISGPVVAHGVTINAGATGYVFNGVNGGALTVTAGGITANESVTINVPVTVGAPQTWTIDSGKSLAIGGDVHTIISPLDP